LIFAPQQSSDPNPFGNLPVCCESPLRFSREIKKDHRHLIFTTATSTKSGFRSLETVAASWSNTPALITFYRSFTCRLGRLFQPTLRLSSRLVSAFQSTLNTLACAALEILIRI
jgi:hypothetical protein